MAEQALRRVTSRDRVLLQRSSVSDDRPARAGDYFRADSRFRHTQAHILNEPRQPDWGCQACGFLIGHVKILSHGSIDLETLSEKAADV
jgi:hypothetical protein